MFKVKGEGLQQIVHGITQGAKKARLGEARVFISSSEKDIVRFYFVGEELQVEKTLECETTEEFEFATTVLELDKKISALPDDELITVVRENDKILLRWGRSSNIRMDIVPEFLPQIEIPTAFDTVTWDGGVLHTLARSIPGFTAIVNSEVANAMPLLRGVYIGLEETGEVMVRATNRVKAVKINMVGMQWFSGIYCAIPSETILGLVELFPLDTELRVSINEDRTLLLFEAGNTRAISRLLVGEFPPIDKSYCKEDNAKCVWRVDRLDLAATVRRIRRLGGNTPIMEFRVEDSKCFAELPGILIEQIGATIEGSEKMGFRINSDYLELALTLHRSEEILLCIPGKNQPITIIDDSKNYDKQVLVVPLVM